MKKNKKFELKAEHFITMLVVIALTAFIKRCFEEIGDEAGQKTMHSLNPQLWYIHSTVHSG